MKLPAINGRKIIPIRLIPFITGNKIDSLEFVRYLAQKSGANLRFPFEYADSDRLYAYYRKGQSYKKMWPHHWDRWIFDLNKLYKRNEANLSYAAFEYEAVMMLPAGVFVWKDEFETVYYSAQEAVSPTYRKNYLRQHELDLNYCPLIGKEYGENAEKLIEGLDDLLPRPWPLPKIALPVVDTREVIPLRLIPFFTNQVYRPLVLVEHLLNPYGNLTEALTAYRYIGNKGVEFEHPYSYWEGVKQRLEGLKNNEDESIRSLPKGIFVDYQEFRDYISQAHYGMPEYDEECSPVWGSVNFITDPYIPDILRVSLFEGFEHLIQTDTCGIALEKLPERENLPTKPSKKTYNLPDRKGKKVPEEKRRRKEDFTEVMEQAFRNCLEEGNTEILQPRNISAFLKYLKRLVESEEKMGDGKRTYAELISSVKPSSVDECLLMHNPRTVRNKKVKEIKWYTQKDVTRKLSELRKEHREIVKNDSSIGENDFPTH